MIHYEIIRIIIKEAYYLKILMFIIQLKIQFYTVKNFCIKLPLNVIKVFFSNVY